MKKILDEIQMIATNYKTTLVGIVIFALITLLATKVIDKEIFGIIVSFLTAMGFLITRDASKNKDPES